MNIASVSNLTDYSKYGLTTASTSNEDKTTAFDSMFQAAVDMVNQTTNYSDAAKEQETAYSLGISDSTNDLLVAQQKANLSLQYTVAVRNHVLDAYKEIMNLQF
jgi:flagellar hook-basal body complex protein FliE